MAKSSTDSGKLSLDDFKKQCIGKLHHIYIVSYITMGIGDVRPRFGNAAS